MMASSGLDEARRQHDIERETLHNVVRRTERTLTLQVALISLTLAIAQRSGGEFKHDTLTPWLIRIALAIIVYAALPLLYTYRPQNSNSPTIEWLQRLTTADGREDEALNNELSAIDGLRRANNDRASKLLWAVLGTAGAVFVLATASALEVCP